MAASLGDQPELSQPSRAQPAAGDRGAAVQAGRASTKSTSAPSPSGGGRDTGPDELAEIFSDVAAQRPRRAALRAGRAGPQCAVGRRRHRPALRRAEGSRPQPEPGQQRRRARAGHAGKLGARLYPAAPQPLSRAGAVRRDAGRSVERPAVDVGADAAAAEGGVGDRAPAWSPRTSSAMSASSTTPTGGSSCFRRSCAPRIAPSRSPTSWRLIEFAAVLDRMVAEAAPPDEGVAQLLHMSLANYAAGAIMMPYGRFLKSAEEYALFDRPAVRRIWRQCRAGRAPASPP